MDEMITVRKDRLVKIWACLVLEDFEEAYHNLYAAMAEDEGADEWNPFSKWWTEEEGYRALREQREQRELQDASQKREAEIESSRMPVVQASQKTGVLAQGPRES